MLKGNEDIKRQQIKFTFSVINIRTWSYHQLENHPR